VSKIGLGKYLIHTNSTYWGVQGGGSFNNEEFSDESLSRQSAEGFFGTELNMYDIGDLNLLTKVVVYPSITESGRWRTDFNFDTKYDLPLDFYIRLGFTLNYDNQPVEGAPNTDYVFQTTFGWEL
jgi:putative salt-induced outer membrane protein YdiY